MTSLLCLACRTRSSAGPIGQFAPSASRFTYYYAHEPAPARDHGYDQNHESAPDHAEAHESTPDHDHDHDHDHDQGHDQDHEDESDCKCEYESDSKPAHEFEPRSDCSSRLTLFVYTNVTLPSCIPPQDEMTSLLCLACRTRGSAGPVGQFAPSASRFTQYSEHEPAPARDHGYDHNHEPARDHAQAHESAPGQGHDHDHDREYESDCEPVNKPELELGHEPEQRPAPTPTPTPTPELDPVCDRERKLKCNQTDPHPKETSPLGTPRPLDSRQVANILADLQHSINGATNAEFAKSVMMKGFESHIWSINASAHGCNAFESGGLALLFSCEK